LIDELLNTKTVDVGVISKNWEEAVRKCGSLLENGGYASREYTEAMVETIKKHGPYLVVAPGVALAHARPEDGVFKQGLSLIKLKTPINFGHPDNDPVQIIFGLAATHSEIHVATMAELASLLMEGAEELKNALTKKEILALVKKFGKK
jgi:mannitol/fructose-specific phosphotransferase system IIA component (Ntr-type)